MMTASGTSFQTPFVQNLLELAWRFEPTTPRTCSEHSVGLPLCYPCMLRTSRQKNNTDYNDFLTNCTFSFLIAYILVFFIVLSLLVWDNSSKCIHRGEDRVVFNVPFLKDFPCRIEIHTQKVGR